MFSWASTEISDFGSSKTLTGNDQFAETGIGTPYYTSPEVCEGREYSYPVDVWGAGCIVFEMVTGHKPFDGKTFAELIRNILAKEPNLKEVPPDLRNVLKQMFVKNPNHRVTIDELLQMPEIKAVVR